MLLAILTAGALALAPQSQTMPNFQITLPGTTEAPVDGRLLLMLSTDDSGEPRNQIRDGVKSQQVFGMNVEGWKPGETIEFDTSALGYPVKSLGEIRAGEYHVQALLHRYETFERADGHTVKLPMDRGEGQNWRTAPGNLFSTPALVSVNNDASAIRITLDQVNPPIETPPETKYIRRLRIKSDLLSEFWGRPMYLGAVVLLPYGFDEHPEARYPIVINHGHFGETRFTEFRETPPDPDLEPEYSERFDLEGYNIIQQQIAYDNYKEWTSPDYPRFVVLKIENANPYYDDSYAVNSENLGPYGDAIMHELLPAVEEEFRCIGEGWSRFTYGGSTGGWEALAVQVLYPDMFNGCFAACPDPIDFRAYTVVDIYNDDNAYFDMGPFTAVARPGQRNGQGHVTSTLEQVNQRELVLGTRGRSGDQWDIWEAVYSPVDTDGYPKRIWDKQTGQIDHEVARYWRDNYDLRYILERDWQELAPKLRGKINIYCGTMDNYYLNNAVVLMEEFLDRADPPAEAFVDYECGSQHCWNGDHDKPNGISRLRYHFMYTERMLERMEQAAPTGADLTSWRY
jgi:hypothetical protein